MLQQLRAANKWQSIQDYPSFQHADILTLAQMGEIDFSAYKGIPRIKALTTTEQHGV